MKEAIKGVEFLARSPQRLDMLKLLNEQGTADKGELRQTIDASRTTIQRNLVALEEEGLIKETENSTYSITEIGELVIDDFSMLIETIELAQKWKPVGRWLSSNEKLDPKVFASAEIVLPSEHDPYAPVNRHVETLESVEFVRATLPLVGLQAVEMSCRRAIDGELSFEIVIEKGAFKILTSDPAYLDIFSAALEVPSVDVFVYNGRIPYYLGLIDDQVQVGISDDEGMPRALIESDTSSARDWAEQTYETYRSQSERTD